MAFGNIGTFYLPVTANRGSSLWGTSVYKVLSAADAASDATTRTDHSTGGAVVRTVRPYTLSSNDGTQADFGWAVDPVDMGGATGARRYFPAGLHVATVRMGHDGATAATGTLFIYIYKVGVSPTFTRTLIDSNSIAVAFPVASGEVTATVGRTLAEVIFEPGETIQYSFELSLEGIAVVGRVATFFVGTQSSVAARVVTPGLRVLADTTGTATGVGTGSGVTGKVLATLGTATGVGTAAGTGASTATTTGTATGVGVAAAAGSSVAGTTGTAAGAGTATGLASRVLGTVGTVDIGGAVAPPPDIIAPKLILVDGRPAVSVGAIDYTEV